MYGNSSRETYGEFDLVLCLGILYHLDGPAAVAGLIHATAEVCRTVAIVDTHVSFSPKRSTEYGGRMYWGRPVRELNSGASADEQERLAARRLGTRRVFWLTAPSLYNLMADAGFSSTMEVRVPRDTFTVDRVTLVGFRGASCSILSAPRLNDREAVRWPERETRHRHEHQTWRGEAKRRLAPLAPAPLTEWVRRRRESSKRTA